MSKWLLSKFGSIVLVALAILLLFGAALAETQTQLDPPTGLDPVDNKQVEEGPVVFSWDSVTNAGSYRVIVAFEEGFEYTVLTQTEVVSSQVQIVITDTTLTYIWQVQALPGSAGFEPSGWSFGSFQVVPSTPSTSPPATPANFSGFASGESIFLSWMDVANEDGYRVLKWNGTIGEFVDYLTLPKNSDGTELKLQPCGNTAFFKVVAYNSYGASQMDWHLEVTTPGCQPGEPHNYCADLTVKGVLLSEHEFCMGLSTSITDTVELPVLAAPFDEFISSLAVETGWSVQLFREVDFAGGSVCITETTTTLAGVDFDSEWPANDAVSSLKTFDNSECKNILPPSEWLLFLPLVQQ